MYFIVCLVGISQHLFICIILVHSKIRNKFAISVKLLVVCWFKSRHLKVSETVFLSNSIQGLSQYSSDIFGN